MNEEKIAISVEQARQRILRKVKKEGLPIKIKKLVNNAGYCIVDLNEGKVTDKFPTYAGIVEKMGILQPFETFKGE